MKNLGYRVYVFDIKKNLLKKVHYKFFLNKKLNINFNKKLGNNFWFIKF